MITKHMKMKRIINANSGKMVALPVDHGLTMGPIAGLKSSASLSRWLPDAEIDALILHKGLLQRLVNADALGSHGVLLHINGMPLTATEVDTKVSLSSVDLAAQWGLDGVSLQLNFNGVNDRENWQQLGAVTDRAANLGLPVLLMLYDKAPRQGGNSSHILRQRALLRSAMELGVDIAKIGLPDDINEVPMLLQDIREDMHVVFAGGGARDQQRFLATVRKIMGFGASGICVGRNIFERQDPATWTRVLSQIVHTPTLGKAQGAIHASL